jgi:RNA-binding protein 5/10
MSKIHFSSLLRLQTATISAPVAKPLAPVVEPDVDANLDYCILESSTCYLCSRQLKSQDQLKRHVKESDLHKARS